MDSKTTLEFTVFNLVIRLSKVNCWPFFLVSHVGRELRVEQLPAVSGILSFCHLHKGCRWKLRQHPFFNDAQESTELDNFNMT